MTQEQSQTTPPQEPRDLGDQMRLWGAIIVGAALILFFLQNLQEAKINFLWFDITTDMIWALISSALLGAIAMFFALAFWNRRKRQPADKR